MKTVKILLVVALTAAIVQCGDDEKSVFVDDGGDASDSSLLTDVTFPPLDASSQ